MINNTNYKKLCEYCDVLLGYNPSISRVAISFLHVIRPHHTHGKHYELFFSQSHLSFFSYILKKLIKTKLLDYIKMIEDYGAGEIFINSIDRDGTYAGYDINLIQTVSNSVGIPVIVCGGAGSVSDLKEVTLAGASGAAAGSLFVFHGKHKAVLISFPSQTELSW